MPIVEGPDFAIEFPEGTDEKTMMKVMGEETARRQGKITPLPSGPGINPADLAEGKPPPEPKTSKMDAFLTGMGRAATFELADEADAAVRAGLGWLGGKEYGTAYEKNLAQNRAEMKQIQADRPGYHVAGEIAGGLGAGVAAAPAMIGRGALASIGPAGRAIKGIIGGASSGGITGFGEGEGNNRVLTAGTGALTGGVLGGAAETFLGPVVQKGLGWLGIKPKTGMKEFLNEGQPPVAGTADEAGAMLKAGVQREAATGKAAYNAQYDKAKGLEFDPDAVRQARSRINAAFGDPKSRVMLGDLTPSTSAFLTTLDRRVAEIPPNAVGVDLDWMRSMRAELNGALRTTRKGTPDERALVIAKKAFDDLRDDMISAGLTSGRVGALADLKKADAMYGEWADQFKKKKNMPGGDQTGAFIEKVLGKDDLSVDQAINGLIGANSLGVSNAGAVALRLKRILGPDSDEWKALRQGTFLKAIGREVGSAAEPMTESALATQLGRFIDSPLAKGLYSVKELEKMATLQKQASRAAKAGGARIPTNATAAAIASLLAGGMGVGGPVAAGAAAGGYIAMDLGRGLWKAGKRAGVEKAIEGAKYPMTGVGVGAGMTAPAIVDWMAPNRPGAPQLPPPSVSEPVRVDITGRTLQRYGGQ